MPEWPLADSLSQTNNVLDLLGHNARIFMFPGPDDKPARLGQRPVSIGVPGADPRQFILPPCGVGLRTGAMLGAAVPKTPVDVDGYPLAGENYVRAPGTSWNRSAVHAVPKTESVQGLSHRQLGRRVPSAL
jgi:hypothetical protein